MKPLVFCILTVGCFALASTSRTDGQLQKRKLQQILEEVQRFHRTLQNKEQMVNTPPRNIEDCCHLSALECFRNNLSQFQSLKNFTTVKLYKDLGRPLTKTGLNFCGTSNAKTTCTECTSHPKEKAEEFFYRLESLIQKGIARLSMK